MKRVILIASSLLLTNLNASILCSCGIMRVNMVDSFNCFKRHKYSSCMKIAKGRSGNCKNEILRYADVKKSIKKKYYKKRKKIKIHKKYKHTKSKRNIYKKKHNAKNKKFKKKKIEKKIIMKLKSSKIAVGDKDKILSTLKDAKEVHHKIIHKDNKNIHTITNEKEKSLKIFF